MQKTVKVEEDEEEVEETRFLKVLKQPLTRRRNNDCKRDLRVEQRQGQGDFGKSKESCLHWESAIYSKAFTVKTREATSAEQYKKLSLLGH